MQGFIFEPEIKPGSVTDYQVLIGTVATRWDHPLGEEHGSCPLTLHFYLFFLSPSNGFLVWVEPGIMVESCCHQSITRSWVCLLHSTASQRPGAPVLWVHWGQILFSIWLDQGWGRLRHVPTNSHVPACSHVVQKVPYQPEKA